MNGLKVLVTGSDGQLGQELMLTKPPNVSIVASNRRILDITDSKRVSDFIRAESPEIVINTAAYTAVDTAETQADAAQRVNVNGAANLARACNETGIRLVHLSTDFVFDGSKSTPYLPTDKTNPLSVYGTTKRDGEEVVLKALPLERLIVLRTAWVYSASGHNFVKTMLRLMNERRELKIVGDQVGTPTWSHSLAQAIWRMLSLELFGIHHWTDAGVASWYDFAVAIYEEARHLKLLAHEVDIQQIRTIDYPTPARRPAYSVLDKTGTWTALYRSKHWRAALVEMLQQLSRQHAT